LRSRHTPSVRARRSSISTTRGVQVPSVLDMRVLTYTFVAAVVPLAAFTRRQPGGRRALWGGALAAFAVSGLHLSQLHRGDASWPVELLGHHASVPLPLAILYQDYPFALADLFLKRALTLLILVTGAFVRCSGWRGTTARTGTHSPRFGKRSHAARNRAWSCRRRGSSECTNVEESRFAACRVCDSVRRARSQGLRNQRGRLPAQTSRKKNGYGRR
jgi:hypothetical protein